MHVLMPFLSLRARNAWQSSVLSRFLDCFTSFALTGSLLFGLSLCAFNCSQNNISTLSRCTPIEDGIFVNANAQSDADGLSWDSAFRNINDALAQAAEGNNIFVAPGTYSTPVRIDGKKNIQIFGGLNEDSSCAEQESGETVIDGQNTQGHLVAIANAENVSIYNLSIKNGLSQYDEVDAGGNPIRTEENLNDGVGAGMIVENTNGLNLNGMLFEGNKAYSASALAIDRSQNIGINNSEFKNNEAVARAAALFVWRSTGATVDGCSFENNKADQVGALISKETTINVRNSTFANNQSAADGGAIRLEDASDSTINNCSFTSNSAVADGSAISVFSSTDVTVSGNTFSGNSGENIVAFLIDSLNPIVAENNGISDIDILYPK